MNSHPVQTNQIDRKKKSTVGDGISLRAYDVYKALYGEQKALITKECRGGFSTSELIALLYARTFPKEEWRSREKEAFANMENL